MYVHMLFSVISDIMISVIHGIQCSQATLPSSALMCSSQEITFTWLHAVILNVHILYVLYVGRYLSVSTFVYAVNYIHTYIPT